MTRLLAILLGLGTLAAAATARADDDALPRDRGARIAVEVAACTHGRAGRCLDAATELQRAGIASRLGYTPAKLREHAMALFEQQCTGGQADACWQHGRLQVHRGEQVAGMANIQHGCELGSGDACLYLGEHARKRARALELLEQACAHDSAHGCELVAERIERRDPARVVELHRKACAGGDAMGCIHSGEQKRAAGDRAGAAGDFAHACELELAVRGDSDQVASCDVAGTLADDPVKARELFEEACDTGYALGCEHLGERIARGEGGERDWGAGLAMVADGCKRAHDRRCKALSELKQHPPDWQCATEDECRRHCDEQLWPACRRVVELAGGIASPDADASLLELACKGGDAPGCRLRGDAGASFREALAWYRRGCALHDEASCGYVRFARALHSRRDAAALRGACAKDPSACALYGLAIAKRDPARAAKVWREACDAKVGVACRFLARTFDHDSRSVDAMTELVFGPQEPGFGVCDCDHPRTPTEAEVADANRRHAEAQRLYRLGCNAGDAKACDDTLGPDRLEHPPGPVVAVPLWE